MGIRLLRQVVAVDRAGHAARAAAAAPELGAGDRDDLDPRAGAGACWCRRCARRRRPRPARSARTLLPSSHCSRADSKRSPRFEGAQLGDPERGRDRVEQRRDAFGVDAAPAAVQAVRAVRRRRPDRRCRRRRRPSSGRCRGASSERCLGRSTASTSRAAPACEQPLGERPRPRRAGCARPSRRARRRARARGRRRPPARAAPWHRIAPDLALRIGEQRVVAVDRARGARPRAAARTRPCG